MSHNDINYVEFTPTEQIQILLEEKVNLFKSCVPSDSDVKLFISCDNFAKAG